MAGPVFPEPLRTFVALFNAGEYWESHEALEDAWRSTGSSFYHGLILFASAFVHLRRNNAHGIRAQLEKTLGALDGLPESHLGIDVAGIRSHADQILQRMDGLEGELPVGPDEEITAPRLELDRDRIRGNEPELGER